MKVALLGKGKTGGRVLDLLKSKEINHTVFDSTHPPTLEELKKHDVIISFLSGEVFKNYYDMCLDSNLPLVCASTGFQFPNNLDQVLKSQNTKWIYATNFSLGMNLVHQMILIMKEASTIFKDYHFSLNEIHHTKKLDAPSGTALSWAQWLSHEINITSERIGDVIGIHELKLTTPNEEIILKHSALDRKIFAEGALFAADKLLQDKNIKPGLHLFQDIVQGLLTKGIHHD